MILHHRHGRLYTATTICGNTCLYVMGSGGHGRLVIRFANRCAWLSGRDAMTARHLFAVAIVIFLRSLIDSVIAGVRKRRLQRPDESPEKKRSRSLPVP